MTGKTDDIVLLSHVVQQIKKELKAAQQVVIGPPPLILESVEVELSTVAHKTIDGKLVIGLLAGAGVGAGGMGKSENKQVITVSLRPPKPVVLADATNVVGLSLAEMIVATRLELQLAMVSEPQLEPRSVIFDIRFGVEKLAKVGPKFKFLFFEFGAEVAQGSMETHRIKLQFGVLDMPA